MRDYFDKPKELKSKLKELGAIFISGGNVLVLRQAMKISSLDNCLWELKNDNFLYAGYSAADCVLSPDLNACKIVDDPTDTPYQEQRKVIWKGLGLIDFAFLPHWNSDHTESKDSDKEVDFCKRNNIPYKTIRDGDVLIIKD